jgi:hypothetical protein
MSRKSIISDLQKDMESAYENGYADGKEDRLVVVLEEIRDALKLVASAITIPPKPGDLELSVTGESENMLNFNISLPAAPAEPNDIVKSVLTYKIGETDAVTVELEKTATEVADLQGNEGDVVDISFVYVDNAGNQSQTPSTLQVTLVDTIPPADPGTLGVNVVGENPA